MSKNWNINVNAKTGKVVPDKVTVNEGDTVTWNPTQGTILAIEPASGSSNLFSSGPSSGSGDSWVATAGNTPGTEDYNIQVKVASDGNTYWIDPKLTVKQPTN